MKQRIILLFLLYSGVNAQSLFLNENDFKSGFEALRSEIQNVPYISVQWDSLSRVSEKSYFNAEGLNEKTEKFYYGDKTENILKKDILSDTKALAEQIIFGPELNAESFIKYLYQVDTVKTWGDRFTRTYYNKWGEVYLHEFYDVDGFQFGNIGFAFNDVGTLTSQLWITQPSKHIIRQWTYDYDPVTEVTRIMEFDSINILVDDVSLYKDGTEAVFWFTGPGDSSFIAEPRLSFILYGKMEWGRIIFTPDEGSADTVTSRVMMLKGDRLEPGEYNNIKFELNPALVDGESYNISIDGKSGRGLIVTRRQLKHITFDQTAPELAFQTGKHINSPDMIISSDEAIVSATLIFKPDSIKFPEKETIRVLVAEDDLINVHESPVDIIPAVDLEDSVHYNILLSGVDIAGNRGYSSISENIHYDISPPVLAVNNLLSNSAVNTDNISLSISEDLSVIDIKFIATGGLIDPGSPHTGPYFPGQLKAGDQKFGLPVDNGLSDGSIYKIEISGTDSAGNVAIPVTYNSVLYDITRPVMTMIFPFEGTAIKDPAVSYAISENLEMATFSWIPDTTDRDTLYPVVVELTSDERSSGEKIHYTLEGQTALADGVTYELIVEGKDPAGNLAEKVIIENIVFDVTPPEFYDLYPENGSFINSRLLSYSISENLKAGQVSWIATGGKEDAGSPRNIPLTRQELIGEEHYEVILENSPYLQDSTLYKVIFTGNDFAGNFADTLIIDNLYYDITAPVFVLEYPLSDQFLKDSTISFSISENFEYGKFIWEPIDTNKRYLQPIEMELDEEFLVAGSYDSIKFQNFPALIEGVKYNLSFKGFDRAGNKNPEAKIYNIVYDFQPPVLTLSYPDSKTAVNSKNLTFQFSEELSEGSVTWKWEGGEDDNSPVHQQAFEENELQGGDYIDHLVFNEPNLINNAFYSVWLEGVDLAGNSSISNLVANVEYDNIVPEIIVTYPSNNIWVNSIGINYRNSEHLEAETITWINEEDSVENSIKFTKEQMAEGAGDSVQFVGQDQIIEGIPYTLKIHGNDRAQNNADSVIINNVKYDFTPPQIAMEWPIEDAAINSFKQTYSLSEDLKDLSLNWVWTGGEGDVTKSAVQVFKGEQKRAGEFSEVQPLIFPKISDGGVYDLTFAGIDSAGNRSNTIIAGNILYDITNPRIEVLSPEPYKYIATPAVDFTLSENIWNGEITFRNTGGVEDSLSVHVFTLTDSVKLAGLHENVAGTEDFLVEGAVYTITITGEDRAGNAAENITIPGVIFDATPPILAIHNPTDSLITNEIFIAYEASEMLESGDIIWKWIGGASDINAPHRIDLKGAELESGIHELSFNRSEINLNDSSMYTIVFNGKDPAGNTGEPFSAGPVTYDISEPIIMVENLNDGIFVNTSAMDYSISENLIRGSINWSGETAEGNNFQFEYLFINDALNKGAFGSEDLFNPALLDGGIYSVTISGEDIAGNSSEPLMIENINYDITAPVISDFSPADGSHLNTYFTEYFLSEYVIEGILGITDGSGRNEILLIEKERTQGKHALNKFENSNDLSEDVYYTYDLVVKDRAGNVSEPYTIDSLIFDFTPPEMTINTLVDSSYINTRKLSVNFSENMKNVTLYWVSDNGSSVYQFSEEYRLKGENILVDYPIDLKQETPYTISMGGEDLAGNSAVSGRIESVIYDTIKPVINVAFPVNNSAINKVKSKYSFSEKMDMATIEWNSEVSTDNILITEVEFKYKNKGSHTLSQNKIDLVDGEYYQMTMNGKDIAGNVADPVTINSILFDNTPPVVILDSPSSNTFTNKLEMKGRINEIVAEGILTVKINDESKVEKYELDTAILSASEGFSFDLDSMGYLPGDSGSIDISFEVVDPAGNESETINIENILFDQLPPKFAVTYPEENKWVTDNAVSYSISEELKDANIYFEWTGGTGDTGLSQSVVLTAAESTPGDHVQTYPAAINKLNDGSVYSIYITGNDQSGNQGESAHVNRIKYDITDPEGIFTYPISNQAYNKMLLGLEISEKLAFCELKIIPDLKTTGTVKIIDLSKEIWNGNDLDSIDLEKKYNFKSGEAYSFEITGMDSAGNTLVMDPINNVLFDNIPPVFSMAMPVDAEQIKETIISYNLNEILKNGWVEFVDEAEAGLPSVKYELSGEDLIEGWHQDVVLPLKESLSDGSRYTIRIGGTDRAGNVGQAIKVSNVLFDFMPPQLAVSSPRDVPYISDEIISYSTNENLKEGRLIFSRIGGNSDLKSPQAYELTGDYLKKGDRAGVSLPGLELVDGGIYRVTFEGNDLANNAGESAVFNKLIFDNTAPEISGVEPDSGQFNNELYLSYALSEPLRNGKITFIRQDQDAGYILGSIDLSAGSHRGLNLIEKLALSSDGIYNFEISGEDSAGNKLVPYLISNITLDRKFPEIISDFPLSNTSFNTALVNYGISERLNSLTISLNQSLNGGIGPVIKEFILADNNLLPGSYPDYNIAGIEEYLNNGEEYFLIFTGIDLAGNSTLLEISNLIYDNEKPVLTLISPSGPSISNADLDFTMNEVLSEGKLIWTPYEKGNPLVVDFSSLEIENLAFGPAQLQNQMTLTDGLFYELRFTGVDKAGNDNDLVLIDSVLYDLTSPVFSDVIPEKGKSINKPVYGYKISEDLISGMVKWVEEGEGEVVSEPQVYEISGSALKAGLHGEEELPVPVLVNGNSYRLILEGTDLAGNVSQSTFVENIKFDTELPILEITKPDTGTFTNKTSFGIKTSEPLDFGKIYLINTGGVTDPESPRILEIKGKKLTPIKPSGQKLGLVDGSVYTIRFEGQDYAGNAGVTIEVPDVTFDNTLPELSIELPGSDSFQNSKVVNYTLSENLLDGRLTWTTSGGVSDPGAPYIVQLEGDQLLAGTHRDTIDIPLVEGTVYSIEIAGRDLAENPGTKYKSSYVQYDFTKPLLTFAPLEYGKYVNHKKVSYSGNEDLFEGQISWVPVSGSGDRVDVKFSGSEGKAGRYKDVVLANMGDLKDGEKYKLEFTGRDVSGNFGEPAIIDEMVYDVSPPEITITRPVKGAVLLTPKISLSITEKMRIAIIYWNATEGAQDSIGHYEIELSPEELTETSFTDHLFEGQVPLQVGTVYSMSITGLDSAWNEIPLVDVQDIHVIRKLDGDWFFKGAIMTVVWTFESTGGDLGETGRFKQGVQMGTKISNQESGRYKLDYSKKPWVMEWELDSGQKKYSLFEITDDNKMRVITGSKLPTSWEDESAEIMLYENRNE